jgi:hypothetical protein
MIELGLKMPDMPNFKGSKGEDMMNGENAIKVGDQPVDAKALQKLHKQIESNPDMTIKIDGQDVPAGSPEAKAQLLKAELQLKGHEPDVAQKAANDAYGIKTGAKAPAPKAGDQGAVGKGGTTNGTPKTQDGTPDMRTKQGADKLDPQAKKNWQDSHSQHGQGQVKDAKADARVGSNAEAKGKTEDFRGPRGKVQGK